MSQNGLVEDIRKREKDLKKELVLLLTKHEVINNNYIGKVVLDVNQGGIRDIILHHNVFAGK
ncbi:MAG: hypothetical protein MRK01_02870 [Candidatus Scalindua sp.]|nr:hypothetical protein [Candidatus Scalindua sp.]